MDTENRAILILRISLIIICGIIVVSCESTDYGVNDVLDLTSTDHEE